MASGGGPTNTSPAAAQVDGAGAGGLGGCNDRLAVQVALGCRRRPNQKRCVGILHMRRIAVGLAIDCDRAQA
jgi:hypothetical protein